MARPAPIDIPTMPVPVRPWIPAVAVRWLPPAIVLLTALIELTLADRKYGLFSGGFGQSRAVDTAGELAQFMCGYVAAMTLLGLVGWSIACHIARRQPMWVTIFIFAVINGLGFCGLIAANFRLHSYMSDAVSFALVRQLGGGSLVDAIKYSLSEIALAMLAVLGTTAAAWLIWKILARLLPADAAPARPVAAKPLMAAALAFVVMAFLISRSGSDGGFGLNRTLAWRGLVGSLNVASDFDGDGYGLFAMQYDAAPFDRGRHPLALDVPGNGRDEDGYGGDLALVPLPAPLPAQLFAGKRPNVVLVVLESVRSDVLNKQIDGRLVAPNLAALAAQGSAIVPAYSHAGFTTESLKSIFTGQLAPHRGDPSLFRDLKSSGYRIGVFSGQAEDFGNIAAAVGMREAADVHVDATTLQDKRAFSFAAKGSLLVPERYLLAAFDQTLGASAWTAPHFVYFNFQSAHFPYHHEGVKLRFTRHPLDRGAMHAGAAKQVQRTYWNAVAEADAWLGQVVVRLKALGVWDNTILLVTGDHGEDLFEDGFLGHGHLIDGRQNATMLVANRPGILPPGPVALADYRAILAAAIRGKPPQQPFAPPFMHIGSLEAPTAIGLAGPGGLLTSLRLDTGDACFVEQHRCRPYPALAGSDLRRVDAVIARWGSERWREHQR